MKQAYELLEKFWHWVLGSPLGTLMSLPVSFTKNYCITCHWYRSLVLGIGIGLAIGHFWISAALLVGVVVGISGLQWMVKPEDAQDKP